MRIGTAEQTVLVSLAQAFASKPNKSADRSSESGMLEEDVNVEESLNDEENLNEVPENDSNAVLSPSHESDTLPIDRLVENIQEREPPEAKTLRNNHNLTKEKRNELAIIVVKRAFSECPSLDILVKALLTTSLHDIHKACRLIPGVPVAPMLAKPTKVCLLIFIH